MKTRIKLTIDDHILTGVKHYAKENHISVSRLVEEYLRSITKPGKESDIIELAGKFKLPDISPEIDLVELYYQDRAEKYGF